MGASSSTCSSSTITDGRKYGLFISFHGEDVRRGFLSHLRGALSRKEIDFFVDENLQQSEEIWPVLLRAIEESVISVVIFSKHYASSKWCLDELVKILECKEEKKQKVMPVFYRVNPSDVRKQRGSFKDAFVNRENESEEKKQIWRAALTKAADLAGWDSSVITPESILVDEIVKRVSNILNSISSSSNLGGLVGLDSRIEKVKSLLDFETVDFRVVGIWGMGGIGKTTIIGAVFEQISIQFEFEGCFFVNIKESEKCGGLLHLRKEIICKILEDEIVNLGTPNIPTLIKRRLQKKKVFIVLDGVDNLNQLEILVGGLYQFGLGSRVIITTRDKELLRNYGVVNIYEVETLSYLHSHQLFCKWAFKQDHPREGLYWLVAEVVNYAKGNPLALKVLGSSLNGKSKQDWESALDKLQRSLNPIIHDVLKISYDVLDDEQRDMFLDIACFFNGKDKDYVAKILDDCYYSLSVLIDKSLVTLSRDTRPELGLLVEMGQKIVRKESPNKQGNHIQMHDLLQELGREIVRKESPNKLGNRSRLWKQDDVLRMLKNNDVSDVVQGIFLDMSKIKDIYLNSLVFEKMKNLRFLNFYFGKEVRDFKYISKVHISNGLNYISNELRSFQWYGCPLKVLPSSFDPEKLVELVLPYSKVEQLWEGTKQAPKLKWLTLCHSPQLTKIPHLSDIPLIEEINLENCKSLLNIHSSIPSRNNLNYLNLRGCENLRSFPSNIHFEALACLDFSDCINLNKFPQISGNIRELRLRGTGVEEVPSSIQNLNKLVLLDMSECTRLKCISTSICTLKSLEELNLEGCSKLEQLPENLGCLKSLWRLSINRAAISQLPSSIACLEKLDRLCCTECRGLTTLPPLSGLHSLWFLTLNGCNLVEIPKDIGCLSSLKYLHLCGNLFESLPKSMKQLSRLHVLSLNDCNMLQSLANLPSGLFILSATNCKQLCQPFPDRTEFERCLKGCSKVVFTNCPKLNHKEVINFFGELLLMRKVYEKRESRTSICVPGNEIPACFSYQKSGSSVNFKMRRDNWLRRKGMGFALCAVLDFEEDCKDYRYLDVRCYYHFETSDVRSYEYRSASFPIVSDHIGYRIDSKVSIHSDHILLGYAPVGEFSDFSRSLEKLPVRDGDHVDVSFEFKAQESYNSEEAGCKVKYSAVHPIYAEAESIRSVKQFGYKCSKNRLILRRLIGERNRAGPITPKSASLKSWRKKVASQRP